MNNKQHTWRFALAAVLSLNGVVVSGTPGAEPRWHTVQAHSQWINALGFSPNSRQLITSGDDNTLKLWDVATDSLAWRAETQEPITALAWSRNGDELHCGSWRGSWQLHQANSGKMVHRQAVHKENITCLALSPQDELMATASGDDSCKLWNLTTRTCLFTLEQENDYDATCVAFSADGKYLAVGDGENAIKLYRVASGELLVTFTGHEAAVSAVVFSPDGKLLISGSWDNTIRVWNSATGAELRTLRGHEDDITSLAIHPTGNYILSGSADHSARWWNLAEGTCDWVKTLSSSVTCVAIAPSGSHLALGSKEKLYLGEVAP